MFFFYTFINRQSHRAWMKFVDRFTRDIQCLVEIAIDSSSDFNTENWFLLSINSELFVILPSAS